MSGLSVCRGDVGAFVSWPVLQAQYLLMFFCAVGSYAKSLSLFCSYRCYYKSLSFLNEFQ